MTLFQGKSTFFLKWCLKGGSTHFSIARKPICYKNWLIFATPYLHLREKPFLWPLCHGKNQLYSFWCPGVTTHPKGQTKKTPFRFGANAPHVSTFWLLFLQAKKRHVEKNIKSQDLKLVVSRFGTKNKTSQASGVSKEETSVIYHRKNPRDSHEHLGGFGLDGIRITIQTTGWEAPIEGRFIEVFLTSWWFPGSSAMVKTWPFQRLSDLQLGDEKKGHGLNHLVWNIFEDIFLKNPYLPGEVRSNLTVMPGTLKKQTVWSMDGWRFGEFQPFHK